MDSGTVWLGFAVICALIELLQLFVRIDWMVSVVVVGVGIFACMFDQKLSFQQSLKNGLNVVRAYRYVCLCVAFVVIVWCLRAMGSPNNVDSGLYHFQSIRWLNEHPLILGLANIHWRFAFNQSYFGFLALLNFYPFWGKGYATGGLFLLILSLVTLVEVGLEQKKVWRWTVGCILFAYFGYIAGTIANPAPDIAIGLVEIAISLLLMRLAFADKTTEQADRDFVTVALLCLTAVTIKLSGVAFSAASLLCGLLFISFRLHAGISPFLKLIGLTVFAVAVHSIRSYVLSGTIMFPSTVLALWQQEWTLLPAQIRHETDLILSLAREPDILDPAAVLGHWQWLPGWFNRIPTHIAIGFSIAFIAMSLSLPRLLSAVNTDQTKKLRLLYLMPVCSLIFWFLTAPDLRFLGAVLPLYIATALWLMSRHSQSRGYFSSMAQHPSAVVVPVLAIVLVFAVSLKLTGVRAISLEGWQPIPQVSAELKRTDSGFYIFVPGEGGFCWDHPLPCASVFHQNLRFKDASWSVFGTDFIINRKYFTTKTNPDPTANQIYQLPSAAGATPSSSGVKIK